MKGVSRLPFTSSTAAPLLIKLSRRAHLEFVMQDAQRVDGGGFRAQDQRSEREGETTGVFGRGNFRRCKITLGSDQNEQRPDLCRRVREDLLQRFGARLKR